MQLLAWFVLMLSLISLVSAMPKQVSSTSSTSRKSSTSEHLATIMPRKTSYSPQNCDNNYMSCTTGTCFTGISGEIGCCTAESCAAVTACIQKDQSSLAAKANHGTTCNEASQGCLNCFNTSAPYCAKIANYAEGQIFFTCTATILPQVIYNLDYDNPVPSSQNPAGTAKQVYNWTDSITAETTGGTSLRSADAQTTPPSPLSTATLASPTSSSASGSAVPESSPKSSEHGVVLGTVLGALAGAFAGALAVAIGMWIFRRFCRKKTSAEGNSVNGSTNPPSPPTYLAATDQNEAKHTGYPAAELAGGASHFIAELPGDQPATAYNPNARGGGSHFTAELPGDQPATAYNANARGGTSRFSFEIGDDRPRADNDTNAIPMTPVRRKPMAPESGRRISNGLYLPPSDSQVFGSPSLGGNRASGGTAISGRSSEGPRSANGNIAYIPTAPVELPGSTVGSNGYIPMARVELEGSSGASPQSSGTNGYLPMLPVQFSGSTDSAPHELQGSSGSTPQSPQSLVSPMMSPSIPHQNGQQAPNEVNTGMGTGREENSSEGAGRAWDQRYTGTSGTNPYFYG